jgi:predicted TPR repeat methyltransferase
MASNRVTTLRETVKDRDNGLDVIRRAHALSGDVGRLDDFYREWADSYDMDVFGQGYQGPAFIAALAADVAAAAMEAAPSGLTVLDVGCGTGLVGVELARAGFTRIDGVDLSHSMVTRARGTGSYRHLVGGVDLNRPVDCLQPGTYDIAVCCGVFTVGHVGPHALANLAGTVRRGGMLVISTRPSYLRDSRFTEHLNGSVRSGRLTLLATVQNGPYIDDEGATYWVVRKDL